MVTPIRRVVFRCFTSHGLFAFHTCNLANADEQALALAHTYPGWTWRVEVEEIAEFRDGSTGVIGQKGATLHLLNRWKASGLAVEGADGMLEFIAPAHAEPAASH